MACVYKYYMGIQSFMFSLKSDRIRRSVSVTQCTHTYISSTQNNIHSPYFSSLKESVIFEPIICFTFSSNLIFYPTSPFPILEPKNPWIDVQERRATDFKAPKLGKGSSGIDCMNGNYSIDINYRI